MYDFLGDYMVQQGQGLLSWTVWQMTVTNFQLSSLFMCPLSTEAPSIPIMCAKNSPSIAKDTRFYRSHWCCERREKMLRNIIVWLHDMKKAWLDTWSPGFFLQYKKIQSKGEIYLLCSKETYQFLHACDSIRYLQFRSSFEFAAAQRQVLDSLLPVRTRKNIRIRLLG